MQVTTKIQHKNLLNLFLRIKLLRFLEKFEDFKIVLEVFLFP